MSDPIKIKPPRSEKQLLALEKARARANEIRLQKAEGATTTTSEQKRVIAMNNRSTRLKKYKNSDSEDSSTESETEEVEEKAEVIEKVVEKPKKKQNLRKSLKRNLRKSLKKNLRKSLKKNLRKSPRKYLKKNLKTLWTNPNYFV